MERNTDVWEEHGLLPSRMHTDGTKSATQACAWTGNEIGESVVRKSALNPLSHTSQGSLDFNIFSKDYGWLIQWLIKKRERDIIHISSHSFEVYK